jgi:hypothetical protein
MFRKFIDTMPRYSTTSSITAPPLTRRADRDIRSVAGMMRRDGLMTPQRHILANPLNRL